MSFVGTNFSHGSLPANEGFTILFSLLHTGIAIDLGFVCHETAIFQDCFADGTLAYNYGELVE